MSIQTVIDKAGPGDTVQVLPGVYVESIRIASDEILLRGLEYEGQRAVLMAAQSPEETPLERAIVIAGNGVMVEGMVIEGFTKAGVAAEDAEDLILRDLLVRSAGGAGVRLNNVRRTKLDRVVTSGGTIAGIDIMDSLQVTVAHCEAHSAPAGLLVRNAQQTTVENGAFYRNGVGIALVGTESDIAATTSYTKILRSRVVGNNAPIPANQDFVPRLVGGVGILVWGATHTEALENEILDNGAMGILSLAYRDGKLRHAPDTEATGPPTEHLYVHDNRYGGNGDAPSQAFQERFADIPPGDLYWDGAGERNQFQETLDLKTYPENLVVEQGGVHTEVIHFL